MRALFIFILVCVLIAAGAYYYFVVLPFGPSQPRLVTIARGASVGQIATALENAGVVRNRYAFELLARVKTGTLKAGVYRFEHPASMISVYGKLRDGDVYTIALTIPEGFNIFDIAAAVARAGLGNQGDFLLAEEKDTELIRDINPGASSLEGYLFPDTYRISPGTSARAILQTMVTHFRREAGALGLTRNIPATVTLASLVERETPVAADRPLVASVYVNRLAKGMPLDADPSVIYAALLDKRYRGAIYASDLKADSPYNTYLRAGLPPGPICNPGIPSLQAAMHPANTNFLYFVKDPSRPGHSLFAATLEQQNKNVAAYRKSMRQQSPGNGK